MPNYGSNCSPKDENKGCFYYKNAWRRIEHIKSDIKKQENQKKTKKQKNEKQELRGLGLGFENYGSYCSPKNNKECFYYEGAYQRIEYINSEIEKRKNQNLN